MKNNLFTIVIVLLCLSANAQITFNESIGGPGRDEAIFAKSTWDGGYVIVGWTTSFGAGSWDLYLVKTDSSGAITWAKTYGGSGDEVDCSVQQTADSGYVITARTNSFGSGSADVYLLKTDQNGTIQWTKTIGGTDWEEGHFVIETSDTGYIHCGYTISYGAGNEDIYLIKNAADGSVQWTKTFGGNGADYGHFIQDASDSGYVIAGTTNSFGAGGLDFYLVKTDENGNVSWSKTYGGAGDDDGWAIAATTDGGYIISGFTNSFGAGGYDGYLIKTDANGNVSWSKTYGGPQDEEILAVIQTSDGGYMISGETESFGNGDEDIYLVKTDANGNVLWSKTFGGPGEEGCQSIEQTSDGGYVIAGYTNSFGSGDWDFALIKTDANGNSSGCNETSPVTAVNSVTSSTLSANSPTSVASGVLTQDPPTQTNNGGVRFFCSPTAVNENLNAQDKFNLYPNPAGSEMNIELAADNQQTCSVRILNALGEELFRQSFSGRLKVNTSGYPQGIYFVEIVNGENTILETKKLVIQN